MFCGSPLSTKPRKVEVLGLYDFEARYSVVPLAAGAKVRRLEEKVVALHDPARVVAAGVGVGEEPGSVSVH